ncbi:MAG: hypothetical protein GX154_06150 [Clostridiales bacterium]|nr:hypothetical protein [Clostridiales bacterium]
MYIIDNLKTALKKLRSADKNNVANRLTPSERQSLIIITIIATFPIILSGILIAIN